MPVAKQAEIVPAEGKLGVLLVGLGAVSTTFIAGVEAIKKGFAQPIGSLTQMGTIRLGKRTDNRVPLIKDFLPLAQLKDLVFGAWDIFPDSAYDAALNAGVLEKELLGRALDKFNGNQTHAAKYLDISRKALRYRMEKFGLSRKGIEDEEELDRSEDAHLK